MGLRFHWQKVPVPGHHGGKVSEREFYTHTPGNNPYLVNYRVVPLGDASPPPGLKATQNRAIEANLLQNHPDYSFYTSEHNESDSATWNSLFARNDRVSPRTGLHGFLELGRALLRFDDLCLRCTSCNGFFDQDS
jgi:hypothetical protein